MGHELGTPLNAIIGLTEMMVTNAARFGTEKAAEPLQRVHRAGCLASSTRCSPIQRSKQANLNSILERCSWCRSSMGSSAPRASSPRRKGTVWRDTRFERGDELKERTIDALQSALEAAGIEFTNGISLASTSPKPLQRAPQSPAARKADVLPRK
jgi:signal transduction histidine kinase